MNRSLVRKVWKRANGRCEYCHLRQEFFPLPFQIDHVIAEQHGGTAVASNLALACPHCNRYKGPNIAGIDPNSGLLTQLFNPRTDEWDLHFGVEAERISGRTPVGRTTVHVLAMNSDDLLALRRELILEGQSFS